jgi:hypothetical protein
MSKYLFLMMIAWQRCIVKRNVSLKGRIDSQNVLCYTLRDAEEKLQVVHGTFNFIKGRQWN